MRTSILILMAIASCQWIQEYEAFKERTFDDLDGIEQQQQGWVIQNQFEHTSDIISKCGDISVIGGRKVFGLRTTMTKMIKIPPHYRLKFNIQFWKLGDWEKEAIQVYVDGILWEQPWGFSAGGTKLCGASDSKSADKVFDVEFELPHNSPQATIVIASTQIQQADVQSWALREIRTSFLPCPPECGVCHDSKAGTCKSWNQIGLTWFKTDVAIEGWTLSQGKSKAMECSGVVLLGGYLNIGAHSVLQKKFTNLPPHQKIMVKFQFWKMDRWDNDEFQVSIDGKLEYKQAYQINDGVDLCGAQYIQLKQSEETQPGYGEKVQNVEIIIKHKSPSVDIALTSTLQKEMDQQSWGIRDFFIFVSQCAKFCTACTGPEENECTSCEPTHTLKNGQCIGNNKWYVVAEELKAKFTETTWQVENADPAGDAKRVSQCGENSLLGGFKQFGKNAVAKKTFDIPPHDIARVKLEVWKLDLWDGEELWVKVDGEKIFNSQLGWNDPGSTQCGLESNWKDRIIKIDKILTHNKEKLTIEVSSSLLKDASIASWGIRNVLVLFEPKKFCIEAYSECQYKGKKVELCEHVDDFTENKIDFDIKSLKIPEGMVLRGFKNGQFKGDTVEFETNQACITEMEFSFIQNALIHQNQFHK